MTTKDNNYDVAVIGGGVIGGMCLRELAKYNLSAVMLESSDDVVAGSSRANSGIVHAGFDAEPGTLKAKYNVIGNRLMPSVCKELGVSYSNIGSIVLAGGAEEEAVLEELKQRGEKNGVPGLKILNKAELKALEPGLSDRNTAALLAPTGGVVCPFSLTIASIGNAMDNGARLICGFCVDKAEKNADGYRLFSKDGREVDAKYIINCAGANSAKVAALFGDNSFTIGLRLGEYILLDKTAAGLASHTLFTVPTKAGKGVLVSPTADGNIIVGPTSVIEKQYSTAIRQEGFDEIKQKAAQIIEKIPYGQTITSFAGVRAFCDRNDFIVEKSAACDRLFNVCGIESPGLSSAPAIGKYVAEQTAKTLGAAVKDKFNPVRRSGDYFRKLSRDEKNKVIAKNPEYGKIICRCESVTLGEILDALRQNPKARTIDGVKLRTRAGMGRCQGGFCQPSVFNLIMKEYGYSAEEVTKNGGKSYIIAGGEL